MTCFESETAPHSVKIEEGCLKIEVDDHRKWYDHIGISFAVPKVTVYLPRPAYSALTVKTATGDVVVPDSLSFAYIDINGNQEE